MHISLPLWPCWVSSARQGLKASSTQTEQCNLQRGSYLIQLILLALLGVWLQPEHHEAVSGVWVPGKVLLGGPQDIPSHPPKVLHNCTACAVRLG